MSEQLNHMKNQKHNDQGGRKSTNRENEERITEEINNQQQEEQNRHSGRKSPKYAPYPLQEKKKPVTNNENDQDIQNQRQQPEQKKNSYKTFIPEQQYDLFGEDKESISYKSENQKLIVRRKRLENDVQLKSMPLASARNINNRYNKFGAINKDSALSQKVQRRKVLEQFLSENCLLKDQLKKVNEQLTNIFDKELNKKPIKYKSEKVIEDLIASSIKKLVQHEKEYKILKKKFDRYTDESYTILLEQQIKEKKQQILDLETSIKQVTQQQDSKEKQIKIQKQQNPNKAIEEITQNIRFYQQKMQQLQTSHTKVSLDFHKKAQLEPELEKNKQIMENYTQQMGLQELTKEQKQLNDQSLNLFRQKHTLESLLLESQKIIKRNEIILNKQLKNLKIQQNEIRLQLETKKNEIEEFLAQKQELIEKQKLLKHKDRSLVAFIPNESMESATQNDQDAKKQYIKSTQAIETLSENEQYLQGPFVTQSTGVSPRYPKQQQQDKRQIKKRNISPQKAMQQYTQSSPKIPRFNSQKPQRYPKNKKDNQLQNSSETEVQKVNKLPQIVNKNQENNLSMTQKFEKKQHPQGQVNQTHQQLLNETQQEKVNQATEKNTKQKAKNIIQRVQQGDNTEIIKIPDNEDNSNQGYSLFQNTESPISDYPNHTQDEETTTHQKAQNKVSNSQTQTQNQKTQELKQNNKNNKNQSKGKTSIEVSFNFQEEDYQANLF